jgi:hypothetical protein
MLVWFCQQKFICEALGERMAAGEEFANAIPGIQIHETALS